MNLVLPFVLIRILSNSFANVAQKKLAANTSSLTVFFNTFLIISILCIPSVIFSHVTVNFLIISALTGIVGAAGNAFLIAALKNGELSILGPINSYKPVAALFMSLIFLKEFPKMADILGIVLILAGSYFIFETTKEGFSLDLFKRKDIQFRIFALILTAFEAVLIKKMIILSSVTTAFAYWALFGCIFSALAIYLFKKKFEINIKKYIPLSFLIISMQISTNYIFKNMDIASALSLFQLSNILNVLLGYKIFDEKGLLKKILGASIMVIGSVFIIINV